MGTLDAWLRMPRRWGHREAAWRRLTTGDSLWCALQQAVRHGAVEAAAAWLHTWQAFVQDGDERRQHHWQTVRTFLACAHLARMAQAVPGQLSPHGETSARRTSTLPVEPLVAVLHAAAAAVGVPCDCDADHGALRTALLTDELFRVATPTASTQLSTRAVECVWRFLPSLRGWPPAPGRGSWAWDVTREFLGDPRRVVCGHEIPVAGTEGDDGFLATLVLEVLELGWGETFHAPHDAFDTHADGPFLAALQDAWHGACQLVQGQGVAVHPYDGRWRLRRDGGPAAAAHNRSASGAAARGWWYALMGKVPDTGVIVLAQVDPHDVQRLKEVDGVAAKTRAIAAAGRFNTIVVAGAANQRCAEKALDALRQAGKVVGPLRVVNLATSDVGTS